jgi:hypothetical protein
LTQVRQFIKESNMSNDSLAWQPEGMSNSDRIAQAGIDVVQQALFNSAFPDQSTGQIKLADQSGKVEITTPNGSEFVTASRQHAEDGDVMNRRAYHDNFDTVTDSNGQTVLTIDDYRSGTALSIGVQNQYDQCERTFSAANGDPQYKLESGMSLAQSTQDGVFEDGLYKLVAPNGDSLPIGVEITGRLTGPESSSITATTVSLDEKGNVATGADGKPAILGSVQCNLAQDAQDANAVTYTVQRSGSPLPG